MFKDPPIQVSEPLARTPWVFFCALLVVVAIEVLLGALSPAFMASDWLMFRDRLRWARHGEGAEILILGDSNTVASIRPARVEARLPPGVRVRNLGLPATGPIGGEILLREYLARHEPPELVVLNFGQGAMRENPWGFIRYPLTHLLGAGDAVAVAREARRPALLLDWAAARLPSFLYRRDLVSGALSLVLDAVPALRAPARALLGLNADRFDYELRRRAARNREIARRFEREAGWHLWEAQAFPGGVLPADYEYREPPFRASPRELRALERIVERCAEAGIAVLVTPIVQPRGRLERWDRDGGDRRYARIWEALVARHPHVDGAPPWAVAWPHELFSDPGHVNRAGLERYAEQYLDRIAEGYARVKER